MVNEAKQAALNKLNKLGAKSKADFFDLFRKLYNSLCRDCQVKAGRMGAKIKYEILCEECKIKAKELEEEINEVLGN